MADAAYGRPRASGSLGYTSSPRMNRRKDDERNAAHTVAPNSSRFPSVTTSGPGARSAWRLAPQHEGRVEQLHGIECSGEPRGGPDDGQDAPYASLDQRPVVLHRVEQA